MHNKVLKIEKNSIQGIGEDRLFCVANRFSGSSVNKITAPLTLLITLTPDFQLVRMPPTMNTAGKMIKRQQNGKNR